MDAKDKPRRSIFYFSQNLQESKVPSPSDIKNISHEISTNLNLASYFQPWVKHCYHMAFIPFKIEWDGKMYAIRTNRFQKFICGMFHLIVCANSCFQIHGSLVNKIRERPEIFMHVLWSITAASCCLIFFNIAWFKKDTLLAICNDSTPLSSTISVNWRIGLLFAAVTIYSILAFIFLKLNIHDLDLGFQKVLQQFKFDYYLATNINRTAEYKPVTEISIVGLTIGIFFALYRWVLIDMIVFATILIGFLSYKLSSEFKRMITSEPENDEQILTAYEIMKGRFQRFNNFIGPLCVVVFLFITMYCSHNTIEALDSDSWDLPLCTAIYIIGDMLALAFSAEAHYQASYFRTWLLSPSFPDGRRKCRSAENLSTYFLELEECNLAIKGGRFFTITYRIIGSASSVVLTYAIILLQLRGINKLSYVQK